MSKKPSLLFVTDLHYEAQGRRYCDEDIALSRDLATDFDLVLAGPREASRFVADFDVTLFRNTGPVIHIPEEYAAFREAAHACGARVFNELTGRGDMQGKQYLLDLFDAGYPVVPTIGRLDQLHRLPSCARYAVKPLWGADSVGLSFVDAAQLAQAELAGRLIQPALELRFENSFYFLNDQFHYALYAPDPGRRWALEPFDPSADDLTFARRFIEWNAIDQGIQRVDGARLEDGRLLLMELEDLNPFLSLECLPAGDRRDFVDALKDALLDYASA